MRKNIKKNYIYNLTYQVLSLITPLITTPYVSRVLGAELIGKNSYAASITSYFCLFAAMGTVSYGQREISYLQDNTSERSLKFWNIEVLSCISVSIIMVLYLLYSFFVSRDSILAIILSFNIITVALDISWFFQGMEEFGKIAIRNIVFKILHLVFILLFVKGKDDLYLYVIGNVLFSAMSAASLWFFMPAFITRIEKKKLKPVGELRAVWALFVPTIAISIYTLLDKSMIGWFSDTSVQNGYYEQTITIVRFVLTFVTSLGTVMIPRIGYCYEKKETEQIKTYMYRSYNFVWLLGIPLCFGIIATADNFIPWFLGDDFLNAIPLIRILSFLLIAIGVSNVTGVQYLIPTKRQKIFTRSVVIGACINFMLNLYLIPHFKAFGAAVASVVSEVMIAGIQIFMIRKELDYKEIFGTIWRYIVSAGIMLVVVLTLENRFSPTILHSIFLAIVGAGIYVLGLMLLEEKLLFGYIRLYFNKIKGKINK